VAAAYTEHDSVRNIDYQPKVWLSWTPPDNATTGSDRISGYVLEFFDATTTLSASSLPKYVVHLAPQYDEFPIPNNWVKALGDKAIVRIRTVRYGSGNAWATVQNNIIVTDSGVVNFNETPFLKALPYAWAETITEKIDFTSCF